MKNGKTRDGVLTVLKMGGGLVSFLSGLLALVLILYSGYVLYDSLAIEVSAFSSNSDVLKYKPSMLAEPAGEQGPSLEQVNKDYRAWITVKDTLLDYPIVQSTNDLYYASHDVYKNGSQTGAIYLAARNKPNFTDSYNILYGHHMANGAMFGALDKYVNENYFNGHKTAVLKTKSGDVYDITFFAIITTDAYESRVYRVGNRASDVISFLSGDRSGDVGVGTNVLVYDAETARTAYKIIALSTCANAASNGRLVLFGRMIKRGGGNGETPVKLTVKYQDEDGHVMAPDDVLIYGQGDTYYVVAPQIPGYDVDIRIVKGTITEDMIVIVRYIPKEYDLRVRYRLPDGTEVVPPYGQRIHTGEEYNIESPQIDGYKPVILAVTGVNPGRDEYYTVIYVPEDYDDFVGMDHWDEPMGLGETTFQIGLCAE